MDTLVNAGPPIPIQPSVLPNEENTTDRILKNLTIIFGSLAIITVVLGLFGIYFGITLFSSVFPGYKPIAVSAAAIFIFLAMVLVISTIQPLRGALAIIIRAALVLIIVFSALELLYSIQGSHFFLESMFIHAGSILFGSKSTPISPVAAALIIPAAGLLMVLVDRSSPLLQRTGFRDGASILGTFIVLASFTF
ncbi:MAG: hypothetical protein LUQ40_06390, partial [Methanomicrobiales archaeon]|nr:hypothetical protein [Methanomicrobiales archaeon]